MDSMRKEDWAGIVTVSGLAVSAIITGYKDLWWAVAFVAFIFINNRLNP